jgi:hypothetical protein
MMGTRSRTSAVSSKAHIDMNWLARGGLWFPGHQLPLTKAVIVFRSLSDVAEIMSKVVKELRRWMRIEQGRLVRIGSARRTPWEAHAGCKESSAF